MTGFAHALGWLTLLVLALPLAFLAWRVARLPARHWLPLLGCLAVILLIQGCDALGGGEAITVLMYWLSGFGRQ